MWVPVPGIDTRVLTSTRTRTRRILYPSLLPFLSRKSNAYWIRKMQPVPDPYPTFFWYPYPYPTLKISTRIALCTINTCFVQHRNLYAGTSKIFPSSAVIIPCSLCTSTLNQSNINVLQQILSLHTHISKHNRKIEARPPQKIDPSWDGKDYS